MHIHVGAYAIRECTYKRLSDQSKGRLFSQNMRLGPNVIKKFMLTSAEHEMFPYHKY